MAHYGGIPQYYYPTSVPEEAHAAYASWSDHYNKWPYAYTPYQIAPTGVWNYQTYPSYVAYPAMPPIGPSGWYDGNAPKDKKKKKKRDDSDSDSDDDGVYVDKHGWPIPKKSKRKTKDDDELEYVMHYVPAGNRPVHSNGMLNGEGTGLFFDDKASLNLTLAGRYHSNWHGRTAAQVQEDRHQQAVDHGVYRKHEAAPNVKGSQQVWVVNSRTNTGLGTFEKDEIDEKMKGKWKVDPNQGSWYFVKTGDKAPAGWESD